MDWGGPREFEEVVDCWLSGRVGEAGGEGDGGGGVGSLAGGALDLALAVEEDAAAGFFPRVLGPTVGALDSQRDQPCSG